MQIQKRHVPVVGLLGLVVVAAAGGSIYYYQFVLPHPTSCGSPVHRLIFMTAIIHEKGGFRITNAAYLNSSEPSFNKTSGPNLAGVKLTNYKTSDNSTIRANVGDTVTLYIKSISTNETGPTPQQFSSATGHGFDISPTAAVSSGGPLPDNNIAWGTWYTVTFTVPAAQSYTYLCTQVCSGEHSSMNGAMVVGCGG